jgi:hypothetical protein
MDVLTKYFCVSKVKLTEAENINQDGPKKYYNNLGKKLGREL